MTVLATLSVLLLAGCGGGSNKGTVGGVASAQRGEQSNAAPADKSVAATPGGKSLVGPQADSPDAPASVAAKPAAPAVGIAAGLTKRASLDLRVRDISAAAAEVRGVATALQALVLSEQVGKGDPGDRQSRRSGNEPFGGFGTLTLSVPADKLDTGLDQLAKIGTVLGRNTSSKDVTSEYVDTESRLKTMRVSVARVRTLMTQARDIGQVVALEGEVSRREADLESLGAQLEALKTSGERSTLTVSLSTPGSEPVKKAVADNGFLAGLHSGWGAFSASATALFIALGAILPFGVFFGLVGATLWFWWGRRRANQPSVAAAPAGFGGQPAPVTRAAP